VNLVLTRQAFSVIEEECLSHPHVESGGILVGARNCQDVVAIFAIGSGPGARRTPCRFEPDVAWQQKRLDRCFEDCGLNYVGSFHRHPPNLRQPSAMDYQAARQILFDPDWAADQIVFPIVLLRSRSAVIYPYYICRQSPDFELMSMGLVPDDDPLIRKIISERKTKCQKS